MSAQLLTGVPEDMALRPTLSPSATTTPAAPCLLFSAFTGTQLRVLKDPTSYSVQPRTMTDSLHWVLIFWHLISVPFPLSLQASLGKGPRTHLLRVG